MLEGPLRFITEIIVLICHLLSRLSHDASGFACKTFECSESPTCRGTGIIQFPASGIPNQPVFPGVAIEHLLPVSTEKLLSVGRISELTCLVVCLINLVS